MESQGCKIMSRASKQMSGLCEQPSEMISKVLLSTAFVGFLSVAALRFPMSSKSIQQEANMVLKNSNSHFNSGTTQRLCNRGAYAKFVSDSNNTLSISLEGLPPTLDKDNPSDEHIKALDKIYEYLGFDGPDLEYFYVYRRRNYRVSLNKNQYWLLPEKIEKLIKEENFLEENERIADIHINKIITRPNSHPVYRKTSCVLHPKPKEMIKTCNKDYNRKPKRHSRGVQRRHLLQSTLPSNENGSEGSSKKVILELEEQHIDTRTLYCTKNYWRYPMKHKSKSLFKSKGWQNGRYSDLRGFSRLQMKEDRELMDDDYIHTTPWTKDDNAYESIEEQEENIRHTFNGGWDISTKRHKPTTKCKNDKNKMKPPVIEEKRVNSASSQVTLRHPKGSFEFIDKPCDAIEFSEEVSSDDDFVHVTTDELNEMSNADIQGYETMQLQPQTEFETFEFHDTFVRVNLQLDDDTQEMLMVSRLFGSNPNPVSVKECPVSFGNCFPPVFGVRLHTEKPGLDRGWNLIGASSSDLQNHKDLTWEVTLKNNQTSDVDDLVKDTFLSCLALQSNSHLSLEWLVEMALESVWSSVKERKGNSRFDEKNIHGNGDSNVFSLDNALKKLDVIENESKVSHEENLKVNPENESKVSHEENLKVNPENASEVEIPDVSVDYDDVSVNCDICLTTCDRYGQKDSGIIVLLPCRHSFCYDCWQTHLFHSIIRGDLQVKCMHTNCNQVLNEVMMNALVPETYMRRLYLQQRERRIDRSPLCQWCPKKQCNKIAVIEKDWSLYLQQFGCSISCDCGSSWCFTCQQESHWPASCGQVVSYTKLLCKVGHTLPSTSVIFNVDLKPCPGCKYPIEKNEGCPHMTCRMCGISFCWKCLQSTQNHQVWNCSVDEKSTFVTYQLHNDVMNDFPLKFFNDSMDMRKGHNILKHSKLQDWLNGLCVVYENKRPVLLPFYVSVKLGNVNLDHYRQKTIILAKDTVAFLIETYRFMEYFYLLLSFAFLSKNIEDKKSYLMTLHHMSNILVFTTSRLEELVVKKQIRQIMKDRNRCQMFLRNGRETLDKMKRHVKRLQTFSRDVPTEWVGKLDPMNYIRYK